MSLNADQKKALDDRRKVEADLQRKLDAKAKQDSDRYDKAVGAEAKPEASATGKGKTEEGK